MFLSTAKLVDVTIRTCFKRRTLNVEKCLWLTELLKNEIFPTAVLTALREIILKHTLLY